MSKNLLKMIGKRVVQSAVTIIIVTLFVFALIQMVPGDPVINYLGATATEEQIAYYRHLYGFDQPVILQYINWITGLFRGTMGQSISYQSEIADIVLPRLGVTLSMVVPAFLIGTCTGILLGIVAAKKSRKMAGQRDFIFCQHRCVDAHVLAGHDGDAGLCAASAPAAQFGVCANGTRFWRLAAAYDNAHHCHEPECQRQFFAPD